MKKLKLIYFTLSLLAMLITISASAQFYVTGDDKGKLKWSYIESDHFKIIYPTGADSLAKVYGTDLERFRTPLSRTSGYTASGGFGKKMPVVMHTHNGANGSVAWAPKRMDLFSLPSSYNPEPIPWNRMLAIHEGRHVTQMQFGMTKAMKPGNWLFGEIWNIAVTILYPRIVFMEGDAVLAETAYTPSGRGRTADFLNYYRVAFDQGFERSWQQWRFPSQKNYSPTYYALGYMAVGGLRYLYDIPEYMKEGFDLASRRPYNLAAFHTTVKNMTGKRFKVAFKEICDTMTVIWKKDIEDRAPFIHSEPVTKEPKLYTDYNSGVFVGTDYYTIKRGHLTAPVLIKISPLLEERKVSRFASAVGALKTDKAGNIYWSEDNSDARWELEAGSDIRVLEKGRKRSSKIGRCGLYFNPTPSPDGSRTVVVEHHVNGGSSLRIMTSEKKSQTLKIFHAPDSLQLVETEWLDNDKLYATAISDNGYGIYCINTDSGLWSEVLSPTPVMMKDFRHYGKELMFTCDRTGVNELYHLDPATGVVTQKTNTRYGAEDFEYSPEGYYLYYTSQTLKGKQVFRTRCDSLINRPADFDVRYKYPIAEKVTEQEKSLAAQRDEKFITDSTFSFTEPKKYNKFKNAFNVHSWAPLYVSVNKIMNMSFDRIYEAASLGVTGILQNRLATGIGEIGYSAHKDPYNRSKWRHSGHFKYTYSGWYPVFELSVDFNDRAARQWSMEGYKQDNGMLIKSSSTELKRAFFSGRLTSYIPFDFSSGGWYRGVVPKISYTLTNDLFNSKMAVFGYEYPIFLGYTEGKNHLRQYLTGSIRAYTMLGTPNSAVYPKWGVGVELGASGSLGLKNVISPMGYLYGYGYIPGIVPQQGLKLSVMYQRKLSKDAMFGQSTVSVVPRGLNNNAELMGLLSVQNTNLTNFSADYAIPIFIGDLAIGGSFLYVKRMVLTPHFDFNLIESKPSLFSVGASLTFNLESIVFLTWPCSVGVTYSYNGGFNGSFEQLRRNGLELKRHFVGPVFSVSF